MEVHRVVNRLCRSNTLYNLVKRIGLPRRVAPDKVYLVAGVPRSGTTWLAEALSKELQAKMLDEPLHLNRYPYLREEEIAEWRTTLPPDVKRPDLRKHLSRAFQGRLPGYYVFPTSSPGKQLYKYLFDQRLIVKTVRIGRLLPWLRRCFSNIGGIVYSFRHPCAVVASQLNYEGGSVWGNRKVADLDLELLELLPDEISRKLKVAVANASSTVEALAVQWCLDNYFPLNQGFDPCHVTLTTYEELLLNPNEFHRITQILGWDRRHSRVALSTKDPSHSASDDLRDPYAQISKWREKLTTSQIDAILQVVEAFGVHLYTEDVEPNLKHLRSSAGVAVRSSAGL